MKRNLINICILVFTFLGLSLQTKPQSLILPQLENNPNAKFEDVRAAAESIWKDVPAEKRRGWKQFKRWEYFWENRLKKDGSFPDATDLINTIQSFQKKEQKKSDAIQANSPIWNPLGPDNNPANINGNPDLGVGRANIIRTHPSNSKIIWAGAAGGGVWKSNDGGKNWETFPFTQFMSMGVSDIALSKSNPNIVYVATGDADGIGGGGGNSYTIGIIKTTDNGNTWDITNLNYSYSNQKLVSRVLVNPLNPDNVFASTSEGIFKTTDGGNSWTRKSDVNYYKDMEFCPGNPNIIYAVTNGYTGSCAIMKSSDNGETWKQVHIVSGVTRVALNVTPSNSKNVYALCAASNSAFHSFRKSTDNGETWTTIYDITKGVNILGRDQGMGSDKTVGQGWYDLCLAIAPYDENEIIVGGINIWKSSDGGLTWNMVAHWYGNYGLPCVHADQHDLIYDDNQAYLYSANDGGIDRSTNGGVNWTNLNNGMNTTQYYKIACSAKDGNVIYGGAQDNGSHRYNQGIWSRVYGGDGMDCAVDWVEPLTAYVSLYNGYFYKTTNGTSFNGMFSQDQSGESGAWVTPFIISPVNHKVLYAGYKNVWRSTNQGSNWNKLGTLNNGSSLRCLAAAPSDSNTIYASTTNILWYTTNGGNSWQKISDVPDYITSIAVDPKNANRFWLTNGGFIAGSKVWEYNGTVGTNITGNLPNVPANTIVYQKDTPDRLYVGTDMGVFYSDYSSANWELYGQELPNIIVTDLEIHYGTKKLRAATYGRGVWEIPLNTCNIAGPQVSVKGITTFCSGDSVELDAIGDYKSFYWSTGETTKNIVAKKSGSYSLIVEDASGCKARSKAVNITVKPMPNIQIKPIGKYPVCENDTVNVELNVSMGFIKYLWSTGDTLRRIKVTSPGKYSITVMTTDSCTASSTFDLTIYPKPEKPQIIRWWYNLLKSSPAEAYQWYYKGKAIAGATSNVLKIDSLGDFSVQITDKNGCTNSSDYYNVLSDVKDLKTGNTYASVFPNPTDGSFMVNVKTQTPENYRIVVRNILGMTVAEAASFISGEWQQSFKPENFPSGIYDVIITNSKETIILKIVKN